MHAFDTILLHTILLLCASGGGKIPQDVEHKLNAGRVKTITSTAYAFAALLEDSSVVTWGPDNGNVPRCL